jgi:bifunctional polynucleotide phosphatase/kinase
MHRFNILKSCRDFAANVGIPFKTPEEFFLQENARPFVREFDPTVFAQKGAVKSTTASRFKDQKPHGIGRPVEC